MTTTTNTTIIADIRKIVIDDPEGAAGRTAEILLDTIRSYRSSDERILSCAASIKRAMDELEHNIAHGYGQSSSRISQTQNDLEQAITAREERATAIVKLCWVMDINSNALFAEIVAADPLVFGRS